MSAHKSKPLQ